MINYPNRKSVNHSKVINYSRRGMSLEEDLNLTNKYYLEVDRAVIYKKPTPITIVDVDYKSRSTAKITEAYFQTPSTTDYNGIYQGLYLDFEAKETSSKTSLVLAMIHPHQLEHMKKILNHKGIAFIIVRFSYYDETYLIFAKDLFEFINSTKRKSIPYSWFKEKGILIPYSYQIKVDYLSVIDSHIVGGKI
ncbi:MAG TPA: Holliday junction resolvase RecU [Erysipelotrichaceae bacterium]|nr:Holliday junction resolvase RecU [Erysipelotrichia bacterium]HPX32910.1 Holliday junction resolvase RecU [Erysipelotrichaceae bacterium]HQA85399.1 Holliday junction resolvase RecU [Erysipelotrichaceae bacterium]